MAGELRPPGTDLVAEQMLQELDTHVFEVRHEPFPLRVEAAHVTDLAGAADGYPERVDELGQERKHALVLMDMVVGVDVAGQLAEEELELAQVTAQLLAHNSHGAE